MVLDGQDVGKTPLTLRNIPRGGHTVRIARDGYVADERRVVVSAASPMQSLTVTLARASRAGEATSVSPGPGQSMAALSFESRPAGASVFLDGKLIGRTPLKMGEVAAGDRDVRLELDGYRRWSSTIHVAPGERRRVAASLER